LGTGDQQPLELEFEERRGQCVHRKIEVGGELIGMRRTALQSSQDALLKGVLRHRACGGARRVRWVTRARGGQP